MKDYQEFPKETLSDFMELPVLRLEDHATVVMAYYKGKREFPVKLVGYKADLRMDDYQVRELGWLYWNKLKETFGK